jgi:hypothetical protein
MAEKEDVFTQAVEIGDEDPFAGSDFGDFAVEPDPESDIPADTTGLPVVNREGERVDGQPEAAPEPPPPAPQAPSPQEPLAAEAPPAQAPAESEPPPPQAAPSAPAGVAGPPEAQIGSQSVVEDDEKPFTPPARDETRVLTEDDLAEAGHDGPVAEPDDAPVTYPASNPAPRAPRQQGTSARGYIVLKVDSPGKFSQVSWFEDPDTGKMVAEGTVGAKRQTVVQARFRNDALKIGYLAVGSPPDGVTLIAVAATAFLPRKVRPKPPEPSKTRLDIS